MQLLLTPSDIESEKKESDPASLLHPNRGGRGPAAGPVPIKRSQQDLFTEAEVQPNHEGPASRKLPKETDFPQVHELEEVQPVLQENHLGQRPQHHSSEGLLPPAASLPQNSASLHPVRKVLFQQTQVQHFLLRAKGLPFTLGGETKQVPQDHLQVFSLQLQLQHRLAPVSRRAAGKLPEEFLQGRLSGKQGY